MRNPLFILLLIAGIQSHAQKTGRLLVDSLVKEIPAAADDTVKTRLYNKVFNALISLNVDEAKQYAFTGLQHTTKMKWAKGIGVFQDNLGRVYSSQGNYDSAVYYYKASLDVNIKEKNKFNEASTYNNLGVAAQNIKGDYPAASGYYFKALQIAEEIKDSSLISLSLNNIAKIYSLQQNYQKALEFDNKALRISEQRGDLTAFAYGLQSIGKIYFLLKNIPKAKENFQRALSIHTEAGNIEGMAAAWSSLSLIYENDRRAMVEARLQSKELWDEVNPMHTDAITNLGNLGIAYLEIAKYDTNHIVRYGDVIPDNKSLLLNKAFGYLKTAIQLAEQTGDADNQSFFTGSLAEVQELQGDFKNAYYNYKFFDETQDSIYSQENKNKIAAAESQLEIDKKDSELRINQLALSNQRKTMWGLIGGLGLLAIIGILIYRQSRKLSKLNTELDKANKIKAKFFGILSHDLRSPVSNLVNFLHLQKEEPGLLSKDQTNRHQQKITTAAESLLENMETLLLWSKSQMEKFEPVNTTVGVTEIFQQLQKNFTGTASARFIIESSENLELHTDKNYIYTILSNLVTNSVNALTTVANATITLKAAKENGHTVLSVTDNGNGFPETFLDEWDKNELSISGRQGLGMHIVKDLAAAIRCKVELGNSETGAYSKLIF